MKRSIIAVRSIIACAMMALIASCGDKEAAPVSQREAANEDSVAQSCRIAYFEADSVLLHYTLAQQLNEESQRLMNECQQYADYKQRDLQSRAKAIDNKRQQNIYLSEASLQHDVEELQKAQTEAENAVNAKQMQAQQKMMESQQRLSDSLRSCVRSLNETLGYDAILLSDCGVYFKPELNITDQIIEELNRRYQASNPEQQ